MMVDEPSARLANFAANLKFTQIPPDVVTRIQWLFLDWYGSAVAGAPAHSVDVFRKIAREMGPDTGPCRLFGSRRTTSPLFAAMVNAAASHVVEQDDLHNSSIFHPGTVVFPPVFAQAQADPGISGQDFIVAAAAGYECGIRVGEYLGRSHYKVFHMTATAGTVAAAMATASLLGLNTVAMRNALGSAGTQAAGLWEFLRDAADSKQLHTAKAAADGLLAAYSAKYGLTAAAQILEGEQGMAAGMLGEGNVGKLTDRLGERWALSETSFKFHASCRHTHPAADALLKICNEADLDWKSVRKIRAYVYQAASDVLGAVEIPDSIHQSKFSMGFVLALILRYRRASVSDFTEEALADPVNTVLREKVEMRVDSEMDSWYPKKWGSRVEVELNSGEVLVAVVDTPKGDPGNMLSRDELEHKAMRLGQFGGGISENQMLETIERIWRLPGMDSFRTGFSLP